MPIIDPHFQNAPQWNRLFSEDNCPCLPSSRDTARSTGWTVCTKSKKGLVWASSPLMRDLLIHLETTPDVVAVAEYAEEIDYWTIATNGEPTVRRHTPALAVQMSCGTVAFIDVMTLEAQERAHGVDRRTWDLADHYRRMGACHLLLNETTIRKQPAFDNRRHMWALRKTRWQDPQIDLIGRQILDLSLPLSIAEIAGRTGSCSGRAGAIDPTGAVYSAVAQLAMAGFVEINFGRRLSDRSVVRLCKSQATATGRHEPIAA